MTDEPPGRLAQARAALAIAQGRYDDPLVDEAMRQRSLLDRRRRAILEIAAARSGVRVWEQYWANIPDGAATLERARVLLAQTESRHASLLAEP